MKYELNENQRNAVIQLLDLGLKSGGLQNLQIINELIVVFNSPEKIIKTKNNENSKVENNK